MLNGRKCPVTSEHLVRVQKMKELGYTPDTIALTIGCVRNTLTDLAALDIYYERDNTYRLQCPQEATGWCALLPGEDCKSNPERCWKQYLETV